MDAIPRRLSFGDDEDSSQSPHDPRLSGARAAEFPFRGSYSALSQQASPDEEEDLLSKQAAITSIEYVASEILAYCEAEADTLSPIQIEYMTDVVSRSHALERDPVNFGPIVDEIKELLVHDNRVFDGSPDTASVCLDCCAALLMAAADLARALDVGAPATRTAAEAEVVLGSQVPMFEAGDGADEAFREVLEPSEDSSPLDRDLVAGLPTSVSAPAVVSPGVRIPLRPAVQSNKRLTLSDLDVIKPISRGGFGGVFLARLGSEADHVLVAVKMLSKSEIFRKNLVSNVMVERQILAHTENPFVVQYHSSFHTRDNIYLVMEYLPGGDLFSLLRVMSSFTEDAAMHYTAETVLALEYLHSEGIVHRDIKPDNILIGRDGHIRLTDFGLSLYGASSSSDVSRQPMSGTWHGDGSPSMMRGHKHAASDAHILRHTQTARPATRTRTRIKPPASTGRAVPCGPGALRCLAGTPDYLAPEVVMGQAHSYAVDWWALGVMLFEFLTGAPPFTGSTVSAVFRAILQRRLEWPEWCDATAEARDLVDKLLQLDPADRLGTINDATEVKQHPFFAGLDWASLCTSPAPFVPDFDDIADTDTFYFAPREALHPTNRQSLLEPMDRDVATALQ